MNYKKLPSSEIFVKKVSFSIVIISFILGVLIASIISLIYNLNNECVNEQSDESYWIAYNTGMYDISISVLEDGILPVFKTENGLIVFDKEVEVSVK